MAKKPGKTASAKKNTSAAADRKGMVKVSAEDLPRRTLQESLPVAELLHRNYANQGVTWEEIAKAMKVSPHANNKYPLWSAVAYGIVTKNPDGTFTLAETGRKILAPNYSGEDRDGKVKAVLTPKTLSKFLTDYNGHHIPDQTHLPNVLENRYNVPRGRLEEASRIILDNARYAGVVEQRDDGLVVKLEGVAISDRPGSDTPSPDAAPGAQQPVAAAMPGEDGKPDWTKTCFFITPIGEDASETRRHSDMVLRHVLEPVAKEFGLDVVRADKIERSGLITQQIFEYLAFSRLCFADMSFKNENVFYELGVRHTCKLPTIQLIRKSDKIPFDVAQGRTIKIDTSDIYLMTDRLDSARNELREHVKHILSKPANEPGEDNPVHVYLPKLRVQF
jgi:hypothetical protein